MLQLTYHTSSGNPHFKSSSSVRKNKSQVIGWVTACGCGLMRDCWCQRGPLMTGCVCMCVCMSTSVYVHIVCTYALCVHVYVCTCYVCMMYMHA